MHALPREVPKPWIHQPLIYSDLPMSKCGISSSAEIIIPAKAKTELNLHSILNHATVSSSRDFSTILRASSTEDAFWSLALSTEGWLRASLGSSWNSYVSEKMAIAPHVM